jgi:hypothetical protein
VTPFRIFSSVLIAFYKNVSPGKGELFLLLIPASLIRLELKKKLINYD